MDKWIQITYLNKSHWRTESITEYILFSEGFLKLFLNNFSGTTPGIQRLSSIREIQLVFFYAEDRRQVKSAEFYTSSSLCLLALSLPSVCRASRYPGHNSPSAAQPLQGSPGTRGRCPLVMPGSQPLCRARESSDTRQLTHLTMAFNWRLWVPEMAS